MFRPRFRTQIRIRPISTVRALKVASYSTLTAAIIAISVVEAAKIPQIKDQITSQSPLAIKFIEELEKLERQIVNITVDDVHHFSLDIYNAAFAYYKSAGDFISNSKNSAKNTFKTVQDWCSLKRSNFNAVIDSILKLYSDTAKTLESYIYQTRESFYSLINSTYSNPKTITEASDKNKKEVAGSNPVDSAAKDQKLQSEVKSNIELGLSSSGDIPKSEIQKSDIVVHENTNNKVIKGESTSAPPFIESVPPADQQPEIKDIQSASSTSVNNDTGESEDIIKTAERISEAISVAYSAQQADNLESSQAESELPVDQKHFDHEIEIGPFSHTETSSNVTFAHSLHVTLQTLVSMLDKMITETKNSSAIEEITRVRDKVRQAKSSLNDLEVEESARLEYIIDLYSKMVCELNKQNEGNLASQAASLMADFDTRITNLESHLVQTHLKEMEQQAANFSEALSNRLKSQEEDLNISWSQTLKLKVEEERDVRLQRLENLALELKYLEQAALENFEGLVRAKQIQMLQACIETMRATIEDPNKHDAYPEFLLLQRLSKDDVFIESILKSGSPLGIAGMDEKHTFSELAKEYEVVVKPLVRKYQLVPEKSGFFTYIFATILANFIIPKTGLCAGSDIESIIARSDYFIKNNDLDSAARELNQIPNSWSSVVAQAWLSKARKYLELKQCLDIIEIRLKLKGLGVVQ